MRNKNVDVDRVYGQRRLHDAIVAAVWRGGDHHAIAMKYGVDIRSVRKIWQTLITEPNRLHVQIDDDIETVTDAIITDTGICEADARDIAMRALLRWYSTGRSIRVPELSHIRLMTNAWAQSRMEQETDLDLE